MNPWFMSPKRRANTRNVRLEFEFKTSIIDTGGEAIKLLVIVDQDEEFDLLWHELIFDMSALSRKDQRAIHNLIEEKLQQTAGYEPNECCDSNWAEISDLNSIRGVGK